MLHKLVNFHYQIVFASQVIQWNVFLVSCLGIWWRHDIWISEKSTFDYLKNEKSFWSEIKSIFRSSRPEVFCKKGVLKHFAKFTGKHLCHSLFFNKVPGLPMSKWDFSKATCFPVNFVKFLRSQFFNRIASLRSATLVKKRLRHSCDIFKKTFFCTTPPVAASLN